MQAGSIEHMGGRELKGCVFVYYFCVLNQRECYLKRNIGFGNVLYSMDVEVSKYSVL